MRRESLGRSIWAENVLAFAVTLFANILRTGNLAGFISPLVGKFAYRGENEACHVARAQSVRNPVRNEACHVARAQSVRHPVRTNIMCAGRVAGFIS